MSDMTIVTDYQESNVPGFSGFTVIPTSKASATGNQELGGAMGDYSPHKLYPTLEFDEEGRPYGVRDPLTGKIFKANGIPVNVTNAQLERFIEGVRIKTTPPPAKAGKQATASLNTEKAAPVTRSLSHITIMISGIKVTVGVLDGVVSEKLDHIMLVFPVDNAQPIEFCGEMTNMRICLPSGVLHCSYHGQRFTLGSGDVAIILRIDDIDPSTPNS